MPQHAVYAIINQNKVKIATMSACDSIPFSAYKGYQIPEGALAAVGGSWAGTGDYLYAVEEEGKVVFYRGIASQGQAEGSFQYQEIGFFENGRFNLQLPLRKDELAGTYAQSSEVGSHLLFIGMKEDTLKAEFFEMDGVLPPVNQLNLLMTALQPQLLEPFELNPNTMHFQCPLGDGSFARTDGGITVVFNEKQFKGRPLRLEKILSKDYSIPVQ